MSYAKLNKVVIFNTISTQGLFEIMANLDRQWLFSIFTIRSASFQSLRSPWRGLQSSPRFLSFSYFFQKRANARQGVGCRKTVFNSVAVVG